LFIYKLNLHRREEIFSINIFEQITNNIQEYWVRSDNSIHLKDVSKGDVFKKFRITLYLKIIGCNAKVVRSQNRQKQSMKGRVLMWDLKAWP